MKLTKDDLLEPEELSHEVAAVMDANDVGVAEVHDLILSGELRSLTGVGPTREHEILVLMVKPRALEAHLSEHASDVKMAEALEKEASVPPATGHGEDPEVTRPGDAEEQRREGAEYQAIDDIVIDADDAATCQFRYMGPRGGIITVPAKVVRARGQGEGKMPLLDLLAPTGLEGAEKEWNRVMVGSDDRPRDCPRWLPPEDLAE